MLNSTHYRLASTKTIAAIVTCGVVFACAAESESPPSSNVPVGTAGKSGGSGGGGNAAAGSSSGGASSGTGGTSPGTAGSPSGGNTGGSTANGGSAGGGGSMEQTATLPLVVDTYFYPSGFMGDGTITGAITVETSNCKTPRPAGAEGNCYKISYTPQPPMVAGAASWGGVYWQHPDNNWGAKPGQPIAAGAKQVSFYAAGEAGGESVKFLVGGIGTADATAIYKDDFKAEKVVTLTTELVKYTIDVSTRSYDEVLGGFGWVVEKVVGSAPATPVVFYIDDVRWE